MSRRGVSSFLALVLAASTVAAQSAQNQPKQESSTQTQSAEEAMKAAKEWGAKLKPQPWQWRFDPVTGVKILPPLLYQNETVEERANRLGTQEDPGPDPDPNKKWVRFGRTYTIMKFERKNVAYDQRYGWVRPLYTVNIAKEVYQENEDYVWVWMNAEKTTQEVIERLRERNEMQSALPQSAKSGQRVKYEGEGLKFILQVKDEFQVVEPPAGNVVVRFKESSHGLPNTGSWRNGLDVADMNGDGNLDLIAPPPRQGPGMGAPAIFLGDGKGGWKYWTELEWPMAINYGTVAAGDLNRDGHQDLVFGVHLQGVVAFLGNGKGKFTEANNGLPVGDFPSRRVALSDLDRDGDLDIVAITEGAVMSPQGIGRPYLRAYLNENGAKEWKFANILDDHRRDVAGDWLAVADFNGDNRPDVAGSSMIFNGTDLIYLSDAKKKMGWKAFGRGWLPFYSYYAALTSGKVASKKRDDLLMSYIRYWPGNADPEQVAPPAFDQVTGIDWISFEGKEPRRTPIIRWRGNMAIWGLALADFDGDGNNDVMYWDPQSRVVDVLVGDGKGGFRQASVEGLQTPPNVLYDIKVEDVNADKRPDVILMFEGETGKPGSIRVWLGERPGQAEKEIVATR